jgi:hypothetical protein
LPVDFAVTAGQVNDCTQAIVLLGERKCLVPPFDGAYFSEREKEALWDRFFTAAPARQRRSVERYNIVKRA